MAEKKISRKELLKEPDEFLTTSAKAVMYAQENPRRVVFGAAVILVCVLVAAGLYLVRKNQETKSERLFDQAFQQYQAITFAPEEPSAEKLDKILSEFELVAKDYSSLPAGEMAVLYSGHVLYRKKDFKGALEMYERMQSTKIARTGLEALVLYHMAMTRFALKDYEKAEALFTQLSKDPNSPYRREAFAAIARIYESMAKNKEAAQAYKQYLKMFPEAPDAAFIRARLAELSAQG